MSESNWVKHPSIDGDGEIAFAGPKGGIKRKIVAGVFDWPSEIPLRVGFVKSEPPEELVRAQKEAEIASIRELAAKHGLVVGDAAPKRERVSVEVEEAVESEPKAAFKAKK